MSRSQRSWALFGVAAFLLAFAFGVDVLFRDLGGGRGAAHASSVPSLFAWRSPPARAAGSKIAYLEFRCPVPVRVRLGDGTEYAERYESVIPVRPGKQRVLLTSARGWGSVEINVPAGGSAHLSCP